MPASSPLMPPGTSTLPRFDVQQIPFSRRGSWLDLSPVTGLHRRADDIHVVSHVAGMHAILQLLPTREGARIDAELSADPSQLSWTCEGGGTIGAVFATASVVRLRGRGVDITVSDAVDELTPFTGTYFFTDPVDATHVFTSYETGRRYRVTVLRGAVRVTGSEALGAATRSLTISGIDEWEIAIEECSSAAAASTADATYDELVTRSADEFTGYVDAIAPWRTDDAPAAALAAYVLWSASVAPAGFLGRESVLMSKHWMDKVWSWDHAFNALALAPGLPDLAIDQFLTPFDHQDAAGALPDSVAHSEVLYNFVKPPIHGWALIRLRERMPRPLSSAELDEIYRRLAAWSRFWLEHRTAPGRELPHYQHGNDSGWDNATTFDHDRVIESPDLAAFLIIQLDVLADLADELGTGDGDVWRAHRDRVRAALLDQLHDDDGFFAIGALSGRRSKRSSLLTLLPVLAADRLPDEIGAALADDIGRHLTPWGPSTQPTDTPEYDPDGYWRGPIWAPSTMLIEDGLRRAGHTDVADVISSRFRALCERSGFAENFDAVTGEGLRDRAYTWTASVYLVFAQEAAGRG